MSSCKNRTVVTDANGDVWDLANPNIVGIQSVLSGAHTMLVLAGNNPREITVPFSTASVVFSDT